MPGDRRSQSLTLHVIPADLARGAQVYAQALRERIDGPGDRHELVTLFRAPQAALEPDHVLDIPGQRLRRAGFDPRAVWRLRKLVDRLQPDVVVAHGGEALKYAVPAAGRRCPIIHYKIGIGSEALHRQPHTWLYRRLLRRTATVAGVSSAVLTEAHQMGTPADRLVLVPNGRDPEVFRPGPGANLDPVIVFVGHMAESKRPRVFVEAIQGIRRRGRSVEALMVGDGPLLDDVRDLAVDAGIEVLGRRDDVASILAGADIAVFTSRPEGEGMPGVLIEAGMSGLPVVATDVPGTRDVIDDGRTGFVVPVGAGSDAFVDAIDALLVDRDRRMAMAEAAREHCVAGFSLDASVARWREVLEPFVAGRNGAAHDVASDAAS